MSHDRNDPSFREVVDQVARDNDLERTQEFELPEEHEPEETREFELPEDEGIHDDRAFRADEGFRADGDPDFEATQAFPADQDFRADQEADFEATEAFPADNAEPTESFDRTGDFEPTGNFEPVEQHDPTGNPSQEKFRAPLVNRSLFRPRDEADDQPTEIHHEPTAVLPADEVQGAGGATAVGAAGAGAAGATTVGAGFAGRTPSEVDADVLRSQREAEQRRAIEDEHRRRREAEAARQRALGIVAAPAEEQTQAAPARPAKRTTDKWLPSLGLLLFRWVIAAILGIRGYQMITDIPATRDLMARIGLPYLDYFPWALAIALLLAALGLVFGFAVRIIGLCIAALAICVLVMVKWGVVPIFQSGMAGFIGELEVLLAATGFLLFTLGGGAWGIDGGWRRNRMRDKYGVE